MKKKLLALFLAATMVLGMGLNTAAATKKYTQKQLREVEAEIDKLWQDYPEISELWVDEKQNRVVVTVVGGASSALKKKVKNMKNGGAVAFEIAEEYEGSELPDDIPVTVEQTLSQKTRQMYDALVKSLKKNSKQYTYVEVYPEQGRISIGMPSNKYLEKAMKAVNAYQDKEGVSVEYHLCPYSRYEINKAYQAVEKDSFIKKNRSSGKIKSIGISGDCISIQYAKKIDGLEKWRNSHKYADMIVLEEYHQ